MTVVGIDVSKAKLAVVLIAASHKALHKSCANTPAGHADLVPAPAGEDQRRRRGPQGHHEGDARDGPQARGETV